jgi:hypothetical protein
MADGYGVTHAGLGFIWRYHNDFAEVFYGFHQISDAGCGYAIVVSNKNDREVFLFSSSFCHKS